MKKLLVLLVSLTFVVGGITFAACAPADRNSSGGNSSESIQESASESGSSGMIGD